MNLVVVLGEEGAVLVRDALASRLVRPHLDELRRALQAGEEVDPEWAELLHALDTRGRVHRTAALGRRGLAEPGGGERIGPMSTTAAAATLGLAPRTVRDLARSGRLPGVRSGPTWIFAPEDVEEFAANGHRNG